MNPREIEDAAIKKIASAIRIGKNHKDENPKRGDWEWAHIEADKALTTALRQMGLNKLADLHDGQSWWYA